MLRWVRYLGIVKKGLPTDFTESEIIAFIDLDRN